MDGKGEESEVLRIAREDGLSRWSSVLDNQGLMDGRRGEKPKDSHKSSELLGRKAPDHKSNSLPKRGESLGDNVDSPDLKWLTLMSGTYHENLNIANRGIRENRGKVIDEKEMGNSYIVSDRSGQNDDTVITPALSLLVASTTSSYEITPSEKAAIKGYLDSCKTNVNFLKDRLIDLLLELAFKNIETQPNLATNYRLNAYRAYNRFNITDLYNYDLNDFFHEDSADYKEINVIVYKLKFINIIYLILQNNASHGDTPSEYKEPVFKYKGLIKEELLNGEKGFDKEKFKAAYAEFRENFPFKKEQSLPVAKGNIMSQKNNAISKLHGFIKKYNLHQPDNIYKLKDAVKTDNFENLEYKNKFVKGLTPVPNFNDDKRWESWEKSSLVTKERDDNYIGINFNTFLVNINKAITTILEKGDNIDIESLKQLIIYIEEAEKNIGRTATETSKPTTPATGGNPPTKYKSTGITVSIMYEKKKYKRTVYTKGNTKTKYCKIDGEYILLSKMKNLSNKNPQRTSPKSRGGGGLDEESDLNAKIKTYLDSSIDTVNFLKHRLVYQLLEYMNSADVKLKFDKDSTNVFEVYKLFKDQGTKGLYVYDLKSFQHYTNEDDIKYKEIDNIVYKLKLINIVYLILKNNSPRDGKLNEYKGNNFKYDLTTLLKEGGTERALDQDLFKADYKEWVNKNKAIENKTPKSAPAPKAPVEEESNQENIKDRLQDFIQVYNRKNQENYKLVDQKKKGYINIQALEYETNLNRISRKSTFNEDTRWDVDVWKKRPVKKDNDIKMKTELININNAIVDYIEAVNKNEDLQQKISLLNSAIYAGIVSLGGKDAYTKELNSIRKELEKQKKGGNPPTKYKSTGITVYILYEKKKYKRTVYTKDNRKTKYCKIDGKYILLSKLNVVE